MPVVLGRPAPGRRPPWRGSSSCCIFRRRFILFCDYCPNQKMSSQSDSSAGFFVTVGLGVDAGGLVKAVEMPVLGTRCPHLHSLGGGRIGFAITTQNDVS